WCFREGGAIHHAVSHDGIHFKASEKPIITPDMFPEEHTITGIYDVSITDAFLNGTACECMTYTGIRAVGDGDVYLSMRPKSSGSLNDWSAPLRIIRQEDVLSHNQHELHEREWCLEGMNLVQISKEMTLAVGVCFLPQGKPGSRQRVVMLAAKSPLGPYAEIGTPFNPGLYGSEEGENGHPDVL